MYMQGSLQKAVTMLHNQIVVCTKYVHEDLKDLHEPSSLMLAIEAYRVSRDENNMWFDICCCKAQLVCTMVLGAKRAYTYINLLQSSKVCPMWTKSRLHIPDCS